MCVLCLKGLLDISIAVIAYLLCSTCLSDKVISMYISHTHTGTHRDRKNDKWREIYTISNIFSKNDF